MKVYFIFFLITLTAAELTFILVYYSLARRIDAVPVLSCFFYLACIISVHLNVQKVLRAEHKQQLLDTLLSEV